MARRFDAEDALRTVTELADPAFTGRHVGTPGELAGAKYLARAFEDAGLKPGGDDGSFLQAFSVKVEELAEPPVLELSSASGETRRVRFREDYRPIYGGSAGAGDVRGPGLFAGHGEDLAGLDVAGKVLLVVPRGPLRDVITRARQAGALAVIFTTGQATLLKGEGAPPDADALPVIEVSQGGAAALLEGSGHTREELNGDMQAGRPLPTFALAWTVRVAVSLRPPADVQAHNVIAVLHGVVGADRSIVVGAHYEEIGPDPDGVVYPAANDNASGTAVLVELARLLHAAGFRPRANIVFVAWSGHEEGLLGSAFYAKHPRFPLTATSLYLNLDTVGQGKAATLDAVVSGSPARMLADGVDALFRGQGAPLPVQVKEKAEGLSDDHTFAGASVPTISLEWGGIFEDGRIHTPRDTAETVEVSNLMVAGQEAAAVLVLAAR